MKLDDRMKEIIAIGASITANCQPCLDYHVDKARQFGAEEDEIATAIEVGKTVRRGAAAKMDKYASAIIGAAVTQGSAGSGCGCTLETA